MKHTPEPWVAVGAWVEHPKDDIPDICTCDPAIFGQEHGGIAARSYAEQCANALLCSAAPSMLELLKRIAHAQTDKHLDQALRDVIDFVNEMEL